MGIKLAASRDERLKARNDLAWAIAVGGIGIVLFAGLLWFTWNFAATLFLIFAGMLLGVALAAMSNRLGQFVRLPHALRLVIVCLALAVMLSGVVFLGGATIAQQATALSGTIKSQLVDLKSFLDKHGIDTSYFDLGNATSRAGLPEWKHPCPVPAAQSSKRQHARLERRCDRQPDAEAAARNGQRGRQFLHRAVSRARLCGAALDLS